MTFSWWISFCFHQKFVLPTKYFLYLLVFNFTQISRILWTYEIFRQKNQRFSFHDAPGHTVYKILNKMLHSTNDNYTQFLPRYTVFISDENPAIFHYFKNTSFAYATAPQVAEHQWRHSITSPRTNHKFIDETDTIVHDITQDSYFPFITSLQCTQNAFT